MSEDMDDTFEDDVDCIGDFMECRQCRFYEPVDDMGSGYCTKGRFYCTDESGCGEGER